MTTGSLVMLGGRLTRGLTLLTGSVRFRGRDAPPFKFMMGGEGYLDMYCTDRSVYCTLIGWSVLMVR